MASSSRRFFLSTVPLGMACRPSSTTGRSRAPKAGEHLQPDRAPATGPGPGLVIHGGAGAIPKDIPAAKVAAFRRSLQASLELGKSALESGQAALDIVELVIRRLEDDPLFNAGKGAVLTADKRHELDASIMCGSGLSCGAVAGVTTVRHPISLARKVMEQTRHVLLAGEGAEAFATTMGVERVDPSFFLAPGRMEAYERAKAQEKASLPITDEEKKGTVGVVVLDKKGRMAAGTSTGGLNYKKHGRVGDSPIVGAGTYAHGQTCAVSCTGTGEEYIRHAIAHEVSARMRLAGEGVQQAANYVIHQVLKPGDGGLIAIDRFGNMAAPFNTKGMLRASANLRGHSHVAIWEDAKA